MKTRHLSRVIDRPAEEVYSFAANPDNLIHWAAGLAEGDAIRKGPDLIVDSPMGLVVVRIVPVNNYGVFDHDVTLPSGVKVTNPARVLPHPDGCEVVFTLRQLDMTDDEFERDATAVMADLDRLATLMETGFTPPGIWGDDADDEPIVVPDPPPGTLDPAKVDLGDLVTALQDDNDYDMYWFLDPATGDLHFVTDETGMDDDRITTPEDAELHGLLRVERLRPRIFYEHMVDFAQALPFGRTRDALEMALDGKGAFRRFNDAIHQRFPELLEDWRAYRALRERQTAVEWLVDEGLVDREVGRAFNAAQWRDAARRR